jgi:hypothetical protein
MPDLFEMIDKSQPASDDTQKLIDAYVVARRTLDDLPYTPEFEAIYQTMGGGTSGRTPQQIFHRLHNLRKAGKLPRLGRAATPTVKVTPEEEQLLASMVIERVGSLGQRDQLPYDPRIDDLAQSFNQKTGRHLDQHDVWRLIAKLAK